ncbi:hypothetical protein ASO17_24375 [Salmonella enterica subsp. enterica serovar Infantis]|nr:hypothetical protein ASO17_24375 [Salmonella enterica subsp. enterica serovar Infantis]
MLKLLPAGGAPRGGVERRIRLGPGKKSPDGPGGGGPPGRLVSAFRGVLKKERAPRRGGARFACEGDYECAP